MFKLINLSYLVIGIGLYLWFIPASDSTYWNVYAINISVFISFIITINYSLSLNYLNRQNQSLLVSFYILLFVVLYNIVSYSHQENYFIFSEADASVYHRFALVMAGLPIHQSLDYYFTVFDFDDLGMGLILSTLYRFIGSNILYNFYNIIIAAFTCRLIFNICQQLMSDRFAFICAISFAISSISLWFVGSGLKEYTMVCLVILFYEQFLKYQKSHEWKNFNGALIALLILVFFRPILIAFCLGSIAIIYFQSNLTLNKKIIWTGVVLSLLFVGLPYLQNFNFIRILVYGGGIEHLIANRDMIGQVRGSVSFTYTVNIISQAFGPLPTILVNENTAKLSMYSSGLLYRVLLAFPFWFGIIFAFKYKHILVIPLILYCLFEMTSLALIMDGLELRKSLPHIPLVFIIAFWFIDKYGSLFDRNDWFKLLNYAYVIGAVGLIVIWNYR